MKCEEEGRGEETEIRGEDANYGSSQDNDQRWVITFNYES